MTRIRSLYLGIFWLSAMLLTLELVAIRHWNVAVGTEGAIFMLPCALSASSLGTVLAILLTRRFPTRIPQACTASSVVFALSVPWQFLPRLTLHYVLAKDVQVVYAVEVLLAAGLCYMLWGCVIGLAFRQPQGRTSTLYGVSLLGSAAGTTLSIVLMNGMDRPHVVAVVSVLCVLGVFPFLHWAGPLPWPRLFGFTGVLVAYSAALLRWLPALAVAHVSLPRTVWIGQNAMSQIELYEANPIHLAPRADAPLPKGVFLTDENSPPEGVDILGLVLDNRPRFSMALRYNSIRDCDFLRHELGYYVFQVGKPKRALVLGPGGGRDVLEGVVEGCPSITAVDVNPLMFRAVREVGSHVYDEPAVHTVVQEGRIFLRRYNGPPFDLILLPYIKKYGSYGLGKDYMITTQGLKLALDVLNPDGILAIRDEPEFHSLFSRTIFESVPPSERTGRNHFRQLKGRDAWMVMYSPAGFDGARAARLAQIRLHDNVKVTPLRVKAGHRPRDDDLPYLGIPAPFFSQFDNLVVIPGALTLIAVLFVLLLVRAGRNVAAADPASIRKARMLAFVLYFSGLGIGFVVVEITMLEKLTLYLGHPDISTPLILSVLLMSSGIGSLWLGRTQGPPTSRLLLKRTMTTVCAVALSLALSTMMSERPASRDWIGFVVAIGLLAVPGVLMGSLFPLGVAAAEATRGDMMLWMYSVNGLAAAVGGSITRLAVQHWGFHAAMEAGVAAYLLSAIAISLVHHQVGEKPFA